MAAAVIGGCRIVSGLGGGSSEGVIGPNEPSHDEFQKPVSIKK
jgi:hypothetical protein